MAPCLLGIVAFPPINRLLADEFWVKATNGWSLVVWAAIYMGVLGTTRFQRVVSFDLDDRFVSVVDHYLLRKRTQSFPFDEIARLRAFDKSKHGRQVFDNVAVLEMLDGSVIGLVRLSGRQVAEVGQLVVVEND